MREDQLKENMSPMDKIQQVKQISPLRKKWGDVAAIEPVLAVNVGEQTGYITEGIKEHMYMYSSLQIKLYVSFTGTIVQRN